MNRISHKQAVKWIDRRLDGLLTKKQLLTLDEHLHSCDACRLYAAEMESLPVQLRNEFRSRWDEKSGPSQKVMQDVTSTARKLPMTNRISSNVRLLTGALALLGLAFVINFVVSRLQDISPAATNGTPTFISPAQLKIDPQSCKPASDLDSILQPPNELYGYELVQGTSLVDEDLSYGFWLYCNPLLKPDDRENFSAVAGLGIYASWHYTGPEVNGKNEYYFQFEPDIPLGKTSWAGPLSKASAGAKLGINLSESTVRTYIQQGAPVHFRTVVNSPLGKKEADLSFKLEPTGQGLKIADLQAEAVHLSSAQERRLAFASDRNGNSDIYTMNANGHGLTNLTNNPAYDGTPFWSPDGKQIAFISDRSGSPQIYLVDADGSNVTQLTNGESKSIFDINGFSPWSPDGTKLVYVNKHSEDPSWKLYAMNVKEKTSTALTSEPGAYLLPAWSPDGEHIVFSYYESEARPLARHLFVVDQNGNNLTELTKSLRIDETATFLNLDYFWSPDGTSVFFTAGGTQETTVYKASLDGSLTVVAKTDRFMLDWWEGTTLQQEQNVRTLTWLRADGSRSTLDICEGNRQISSDQIVGIAYQRSEAGSLVVGSNCSARDGWLFYWANPDGTITNQLLSSPISSDEGNIFNMTWSPDDRFLAFVATGWDTSNATHTLYVLDVEQARKDPSVQPLKIEASYNPSWQPVP